MVEWEKIIGKILMLPVRLYQHFIKTPFNVITTNNKYGVVKKKSYKQVRPMGIIGSIRSPISDYGDTPKTGTPTYAPPPSYSAPKPTPKPATKTDVSATIDHALFKFDDDDDDDFDLDIDSFEKTDIKKDRPSEIIKKNDNSKSTNRKNERKFDFDDDEDEEPIRDNRRSARRQDRDDERPKRDNQRNSKNERNDRDKNKHLRDNDEPKPSAPNKGPVFEALQQKGYDIIENITYKNTVIDFVGVAENKICLCAVDKENGDWLADEELFNGEEPLWFSENSHRVSPVRRLATARDAIIQVLEKEDFALKVESFVVVQMANIINADDMFEVWKNMNINVTRINRGAPKEIQLFSKTLTDADDNLNNKELERLRKVLKNMN